MQEPLTLLRDTPGATRELLRIALGKSQMAPEKGDKRFADPAWRDNPLYRRAMQTYLYYGSRVDPFIDSLGIEGLNRERARFALALVREAMAPTNSFMTNPAALKRMFDTGGVSVGRGMANMAGDMLHNHGMPSMVDRRPFKVGETIAATPGAVVYRTEVFELIQYTPQSDNVYQRPILMVPPQVNKYYALDLAPGRSLYEYLLKRGIQVFGISWRNPTGQDPPAFDILAWNADTTRLTRGFHHQMLDMVATNQLVHPGAMKVLGTPVDLSRITCDTYVAAGMTDHITPWKTCYRTTQMVSGRSQFVLCSSGHIQTVVADPKHRGLGYYLNPETPPSADQWMAGAERHEGSWWEHWVGWLADRSGEQIAAPQSVGSRLFPAKEPAPGTYVHQ